MSRSSPQKTTSPLDVALFDYGAGNLHSLGKALEGAGARVHVTADWDEALARDALVLPGVGAFGAAAAALPDDRARVRTALEAGLPCLGICLGMQLFFETSEESTGDGIGFVPGQVRLLEARIVPQMGWNDVETGADFVFEGVGPLVAYYANSYVCVPETEDDAIAWSEYDGHRFAAGVRRGNSWGFQFHPEKSSGPGRRIIANFVALAREAR
ncbi:MAG TPA: imidazole glycerol phosphate synthase subunit HisH [Gaiellaceae bacterium]|nr:imidazole glycerol phosphate synthase subunit HisH [Gaiellaceae bacterium]